MRISTTTAQQLTCPSRMQCHVRICTKFGATRAVEQTWRAENDANPHKSVPARKCTDMRISTTTAQQLTCPSRMQCHVRICTTFGATRAVEHTGRAENDAIPHK